MKKILMMIAFIAVLASSSISYAYDVTDDYQLGYNIGTNLKALSGNHEVQDYWNPAQKEVLPNIKKVIAFTYIDTTTANYIGYNNANNIVLQAALEALIDKGYQVQSGEIVMNNVFNNYQIPQERTNAFVQEVAKYDATLIIKISSFTIINGSALVALDMRFINTKDINKPIIFAREEIRVSNPSRFKVPSADGTAKRMINNFVKDFVKESEK